MKLKTDHQQPHRLREARSPSAIAARRVGFTPNALPIRADAHRYDIIRDNAEMQSRWRDLSRSGIPSALLPMAACRNTDHRTDHSSQLHAR
ncbi:MAG: hypothetical protein IPI28_00780 [Candidatus Omnitrophica bacterium]|nr:hypothetical protein [Candidatus Omnitrophota bacterium]